jgi:hypothetical protein
MPDRPTLFALAALVRTLEAERSAAAAAGDIWTADARSADIATVERTIALVDGERDDV